MKKLFLIVVFVQFFTLYAQENSAYSGRVIIKLKSGVSTEKTTFFQNIPDIELHQPMFMGNYSLNEKAANKLLSQFYYLEIKSNTNVEQLVAKLNSLPFIEYAEREFTNRLIYQPNDTINYRQWYLNSINAFNAWNITKGDSTVTIAIVDTGTDTDHEDLAPTLYTNSSDPINGIDDDADGFIDNYYGWDTGSNDSDVNPESHGGASHGSNCAGIASAATDNVLGISGVGFNTELMTVKIDNPAGQLVGAYQGIVYAADMGADVINCSWGSYGFSQAAQDIINYAHNKGALIVAGAGNGPFTGPAAGIGVEEKFYPAAYDNVIAVGSLIEGDTVKQSSNYGYWLDIFAPGEAMFTTNGFGGYSFNGGTSMAAPVVAGVAALIKSANPSFSNDQIAQRLYNSGVNVNGVNVAKYTNKLGNGKVDAFQALIDTTSPGIDLKNRLITDNKNNNFNSGDTLYISGDFINYLEDASNVNVLISEVNGKATVISGSRNLGNINSGDTVSITASPFTLRINNGIGINEELTFNVRITATNYVRDLYFSTVVNSDFLTITNGDLTVTLSSTGSIGYTGPNRSLGSGIKYNGGNSLLYEGSYMIGNASSYVADKFRGNPNPNHDFDYITLVNINSNTASQIFTNTVFDDRKLAAIPNFRIEQSNFFLKDPSVNNASIFVYKQTNISNQNLQQIHSSIIMDWDIANYANNRIIYDSSRRMGVSYSTDTSLYCGIMSLNHRDSTFHYAMDNIANGGGGINPNDGLSTSEKYQLMRSNRDSAGWSTTNGNDIIDLIAQGPFDLAPQASVISSYAVIIADSLTQLNQLADSISILYQGLSLGITSSPSLPKSVSIKIAPNPSIDYLNISLELPQADNFNLEVYDLKGALVYTEGFFFNPGKHQIRVNTQFLKSGVYFIRMNGDRLKFEDKFVVQNNN